MKIALVTIHCSTNYGAVLQAFATQTVLSRFGEVVVIDYNNKFLLNQMSLLRFQVSLHGLLKVAHDLLRLPSRFRQLRKFDVFFKTKLNRSEKFSGECLFRGQAGLFDVYVCGSDQIWNPLVVNEVGAIDKIYFLGFAPSGSKKISYASSVGHYKFSADDRKVICSLLADFSSISMREADGVAMVSEILEGRDIKHVLDPTLLLSSAEWCRLMDVDNSSCAEKYILVYTVPRSALMRKAVSFYRDKLGFKVVGIDPMFRPIAPFDRHLRDAGPEEFVRLFSGAEFVVTDSFHGVCFSVNFCKPFVLVSPGVRSNRMKSLFDLLELNHRMVTVESEFSSISLCNADVKESSEKLSFYRDQSIGFIRDSLQP